MTRAPITAEEVEAAIQDRGLTAPRVTESMIRDKIDSDAYHVFPDTTVTVCCLTLANGFCVVGTSAAASPENFDAALGERLAYADAYDQIWHLEGYLLREYLTRREASAVEDQA